MLGSFFKDENYGQRPLQFPREGPDSGTELPQVLSLTSPQHQSRLPAGPASCIKRIVGFSESSESPEFLTGCATGWLSTDSSRCGLVA